MILKTFFTISVYFFLVVVSGVCAQECFQPILANDDEIYCSLPSEYEEVNHTCRRQLQAITDELSKFAGTGLGDFIAVPITTRDGSTLINAMTCPLRRKIWIGLEAWYRLEQRESSLAYMIGHEISHAYHVEPETLVNAARYPEERQLLAKMNDSQLLEIACDQGSANLLLKAGYQPWEIIDAAKFIAFQSEPSDYQSVSLSHPTDEDRIALLSYYLLGR